MAVVTDLDQDNEKLNPGAWDDEKGARRGVSSGLSEAENNSFNDIAGNFNKSADSSQEDANISRVRNAEQTPTPQAREKESDKFDKPKPSTGQKFSLKSLKKKGPLGFIGALVLTGGGIFSALLSPGIGLVQIKQAVMDDLNDSLASMDYRSQHIYRAKLKKQTTGFCTKNLSVRCKYRNMSEKQIEKLRKAGIHVDTDGKTLTGRYRVTALIPSKPDGTPDVDNKIGADKFMNEYNRNPDFRGNMHRGWNPRWSTINDKMGQSIAKKFGVIKKRIFNGQNEEETKKEWNKAVKDGFTESDGREGLRKVTNEDGTTRYVDGNGNDVTNSTGDVADANQVDENIKKVKEDLRSNAASRGFGKLARGVNTFTGLEAEGCSWYKKLKLAGTVSRNLKYAQMLRAFWLLANTVDATTDGEGTYEAMSSLSALALLGDGRDKIPATENIVDANSSLFGQAQAQLAGPYTNPNDLIDNPDKGKNAFDSAGMKASMYGDVPAKLNARDAKTSLTGGPGGSLTNASQKIANFPGVDISRCHIYENPIVQGGSIVLSLGLAFGTGGGSAAATIARMVPTVIIGLAIETFVDRTIAGISDGSAFDWDNAGNVDFGNIAFGGGAATLGSSASSRGMTPVSTQQELVDYKKSAQVINNQYEQLDKIAAQKTPFDVYDQYSFLGSIVWSINPSLIGASSSMAGYLSMPFTLFGSMLQINSPVAKAQNVSDIRRFQKNDDDPVYSDMNLKGSDLMGNVRFAMSDEQLNADPDKVVSWMVDARQVDSIDGKVLASCDALQQAINLDPTTESLAYMQDSSEPYSDIALGNDQTPNAELTENTQWDKSYPNAKGEKVYDGLSTYAKGNLNESQCDEIAKRDVRTYAHFLRFCRFGPDPTQELARTVNFGDGDGGDLQGNALGGLVSGAWQSDGRECLKSNTCKPGQDPNGSSQDLGSLLGNSEQYKHFCRPSYYDIYAVYTMDNIIDEGFDQDDNASGGDNSGDLASGDARDLARQLANNPNIEYVNPATKKALLSFADTGKATSYCGDPNFKIDPLLSGVMLANAKKYKIYVNNFGFKEDRFAACDQGQHPKGKAVDLNGIKKLDGGGAGGTGWGSINYSNNEEAQTVSDYATDWMDILAKDHPNVGRAGQVQCNPAIFNLVKNRKPAWKGADGNLHFNDSCDHLHIDVGER